MNFKINENLFRVSLGWVIVSNDIINIGDQFLHTETKEIYECVGINKYGEIVVNRLFFKTSYPKSNNLKKIHATINCKIGNLPYFAVENFVKERPSEDIVEYIDNKMCRWSTHDDEIDEYHAYLLGLKDGVEFMKNDVKTEIIEIDVDLESLTINNVLWRE